MSDYDTNKMNYKQLRNEVQLLRDELALMKRKYEDIIYNLDDDNFSSKIIKERDNMKAEISITAQEIKTKVSRDVLGAYSTISQTAEAITSVVSKNANVKDAIPIRSIEKATDKDAIYVVQDEDDNGLLSETYYYYNDLIKDWEVLDGNNIYTVFNQTTKGFRLKGNVDIDGSLIIDGSVSANAINTENLSCERLYSKGYKTDGYYAKMSSQWGDFGIFTTNAAETANTADAECVWGIYQSDLFTTPVNFYVYGNNYMGYSTTQKRLYPKGEWDFSSATVSNLNTVAVFG